MMINNLERLPRVAAVLVVVLIVAACAIRLRGDESDTESPRPLAPKSDWTAAKLEQCRTVSSEQRDVLLECQRMWAEKRCQFFGQSGSSAHPEAKARSSSPVPPKDESRLPSGYPFLPAQSE
ncbi:MAG TPA: putative entry exclusion protein TrbK-alt [Sphingomicrobium sp.]|nr:putative entry exclusion protein TrbK-alt [Sphingomicrobium sp.]